MISSDLNVQIPRVRGSGRKHSSLLIQWMISGNATREEIRLRSEFP